MRHEVCTIQIFSGVQGLQVGSYVSVGCTYLSWDWFENIFMYWFAQVTGGDPEKNGGAQIIGGNKVFIFQQKCGVLGN